MIGMTSHNCVKLHNIREHGERYILENNEQEQWTLRLFQSFRPRLGPQTLDFRNYRSATIIVTPVVANDRS